MTPPTLSYMSRYREDTVISKLGCSLIGKATEPETRTLVHVLSAAVNF